MKDVPLRIEIGPKDLDKKQVVIVRRDNNKKEIVAVKDVVKTIDTMLDAMQKDLYLNARKMLESKIDSARDVNQLIKKLDEGKIVKVFMVDDKKIEEKLKEETGA